MQVQVDDEFKMEEAKLLDALKSVKLKEEKHLKSPASSNHKRQREAKRNVRLEMTKTLIHLFKIL